MASRLLEFRIASTENRTLNPETPFPAARARLLHFGAAPEHQEARGVPAECLGWLNVDFWPAYPKKVGRHDAEAAILRLLPSPVRRDQMLAFVKIARTSKQWRNRRDIPRPAAWLKRWLDEDECAV